RAHSYSCNSCRAAAWRRWRSRAKKICHIGRAAGDTGIAVYAQGVERRAQHILVLVKSCGLEAFTDSGTRRQRDYVSSAVRRVGVEAFIENNNQDAILLEFGTIE